MKKGTTKYNLVGQRFGKLVVVECLGTSQSYHLYWRCVCDCGKETKTRNQNLLRGKSKSCGCGDLQRKRDLASALKESNKKDPIQVAERYIFNEYTKEAKKRKLEFRLSIEELKSLIHSSCYYCGLAPSNIYKVIRHDANVPVLYSGIDRVDSTIGYVVENVVPCCKNCNYAKNSMTVSEFIEWIKRIYNRFVVN